MSVVLGSTVIGNNAFDLIPKVSLHLYYHIPQQASTASTNLLLKERTDTSVVRQVLLATHTITVHSQKMTYKTFSHSLIRMATQHSNAPYTSHHNQTYAPIPPSLIQINKLVVFLHPASVSWTVWYCPQSGGKLALAVPQHPFAAWNWSLIRTPSHHYLISHSIPAICHILVPTSADMVYRLGQLRVDFGEQSSNIDNIGTSLAHCVAGDKFSRTKDIVFVHIVNRHTLKFISAQCRVKDFPCKCRTRGPVCTTPCFVFQSYQRVQPWLNNVIFLRPQ